MAKGDDGDDETVVRSKEQKHVVSVNKGRDAQR